MARSIRGNILRRPSQGEARARGGLFRFIGEVVSELKKVTWPSRQETTRLTLLVIAVSVVIAAFLFMFDQVFTAFIDLLL